MQTQLSNPIKGLNTDSPPKHQPQGTYRYALNAIAETTKGDHATLSNELGNIICGITSKQIIGHALMDKQEIFIVSYPDEIGVFNIDSCSYTPIKIDSCFNFSLDHPVHVQFRIRNGCDRTVYLADDYNSYRVINLDALPTPFTCNQIKYSKDYLTPEIKLKSISEGGSLLLGTYQFAIRYLDKSYNATNWILISNSVPIVDEPTSVSYGQYDGGLNPVDNNTIIGEAKSNKKITLEILDLDTNFVYYEIAILSYTSGTQTLTKVVQSNPIDISQTLFNYTGLESYSTLDITDLLVDDVYVDKVATHAQLDNRLYLGNVTEYAKDYSNYQKFASKINAHWVATGMNYNVHNSTTSFPNLSPKNELYYFNNIGFHPDEINSFGIVFVHANGMKSPVFHIVGRCPTADDLLEIPNTDLNIFNPSKTKNWQVYNTAAITHTDLNGRGIKGTFGYYETTTKYPTVNTCDNPDDYWGVGCDGTKLTGQPIRHHRFPAWDLIANLDENVCAGADVLLGVEFSNIVYPDSDIVSHYFVFGDRTHEHTIYDSVYLHGAPTKEVNNVFDQLKYNAESLTQHSSNYADKSYNALSTKTWYDNDLATTDYFRAVKIYSIDDDATNFFTAKDVRVPNHPAEIEVKVGVAFNLASHCNAPVLSKPTGINFKIKDVVTIPPTEDFSYITRYPMGDLFASNGSTINYASFITTDRTIGYGPLDNASKKVFIYGYLKYDRDVFEDLSSIQYINNNNKAKSNILYSGDTFNSSFTFVEFDWAASNGDANVNVEVISMFLSFQLNHNYSFRHGDKTDLQYSYYKYEPLQPITTNGKALAEYVAGKVYYTETGDLSDATPYVHPETYLYNKDYSVASSPERYTSLPFKFDYCNECSGKHPYRIYYSQLDNQEGLEDNYLKILPLSYKDLDGSQGPITALINNFNNLFAITTHTAYFLPTRPQQLGTNESTIYIGTGEVLSTPPRQLKTTDFEFGGTDFHKSIASTEYGAFYVDNYSGTPFLLTDNIVSIADGLRNEWKNNGPILLTKYLKTLGHDYQHLATTSGVGYISTYDPRHKRIIVHKKDYLPIVPFSQGNTSGILDFYKGEIVLASTKQPVALTNTKYFKNVSFTMSYSFLTGSWTSYHSYEPKYMFNSYDTFYSNSGANILKHNAGDYQTYSGIKYDHVVEVTLVSQPFISKTTESIMYESESSVNSNYTEITFDRFIAYNDKQSTGLQKLIPSNIFGTNAQSTTNALLKRKDKYWRINELRDLSINNQPALIDNIPNALKIDPNKSQFYTERLRDYYLNCRLYFKPESNQKISTDLVSVVSSPTKL